MNREELELIKSKLDEHELKVLITEILKVLLEKEEEEDYCPDCDSTCSHGPSKSKAIDPDNQGKS